MNPIPRAATALVAAGLLGTLLTGCGSGTDRAVPGPTSPPGATPAGGWPAWPPFGGNCPPPGGN